MKLGLLNVRSVRNKIISLCETLSENKISICGITETWLQDCDTTIEREFGEHGYALLHRPRLSKRGGGVGFLYRNYLKVDMLNSYKPVSFEMMEVVLQCKSRNLFISTIYRTGQLSLIERKAFLKEFEEYLEVLSCRKELIILWGDFNIHIQDKNNKLSNDFSELVFSYGFSQIVSSPTHIGGNILDLVLVKQPDAISQLNVLTDEENICLSDHFLIELEIPEEQDKIDDRKLLSYKKFSVDKVLDFKQDLRNSRLNWIYPDAFPMFNFNEHVSGFFSYVNCVVNKYSPKVTETRRTTEKPFTNKLIKEARRQKRRAERRYKKTKLKVDKTALNDAARSVNKCVKQSLDDFYAVKFGKVKGDQKGTYKIINHLLNRSSAKIYPEKYDPKTLANQFEEYFTNKIESIRIEIESMSKRKDSNLNNGSPELKNATLTKFDEVTEDTLTSILKLVKQKYSSIDDIPVEALDPIFEVCLPDICKIVNFSLQNGIFPDHLKTSHITPIIKGSEMDRNLLSSYRPISSISFLSKVIEKCAALQLYDHLTRYNLHLDLQSAYKENYSCETALVKVYEDILCDINSSTGVIMVFLDLSAAFDTVDHELMVNKLRNRFLVGGSVLLWFKSYLSDRRFHVKIDNHLSKGRSSKCGVPQGSILGPVLFSLYSQEVHEIIQSHELQYHIYADDIQIYFKYSRDSVNQFSKLRKCLSDIKLWAANNYLKFNETKTKYLNITSVRSKLQITESDNLTDEVVFVDEVKNLGVIIDHSLTFKSQINKVCRQGFATLSSLWRISSKIKSIPTKIQIVHALIISQIDYCNSLYVSLPNQEIKKLQRLMNGAVRFIYNLSRKQQISITEYIKKCHFLPVDLRIKFKICCLVFKCLQDEAPNYLTSLLTKKKSLQSLRIHQDKTLLQEQPQHTENYKNRRFAIVAPRLWNELPRDTRESDSLPIFKSKLKTFFFDKF